LFLCLLAISSCTTRPTSAAAPKVTPFRFIHSSDSHFSTDTKPGSNAANDIDRFDEISALTPRPAFIVNTGDVCDHGTQPEYDTYQKALKHLACPIYDSTGNHDIRWNPLGKEGFILGTHQPLYQSWDYNGIHFVALDSCVLLQHWGHFDQAELDWLKKDLAKLPSKDTPLIIGFHHWIGRDPVMLDNAEALYEIVKPYNVRLWLQGHGHSDIDWNINGVPAIMEGGLYQGSYTIIDVTSDSMKLTRRQWGKVNPETELMTPAKKPGRKNATSQATTEPLKAMFTQLMTIPLARPVAPKWNADAKVDRERAVLTLHPGNLPANTKFTYRFDQSKSVDLSTPTTQPSLSHLHPGIHRITVEAQLTDGRAYQLPLNFTLHRKSAPEPAWSTNIHGAVLSHLTHDDHTVYLTTMGNDLVAVDPSTGKTRWTFPTGNSLFSTPQVDHGTIYFGSTDHYVYAVDCETGKQKWRFETKAGVFGGPAVAEGVVAIASTDKNIYGLDAQTGEKKWKVPVGGMYQSKAATDGSCFFFAGWDNTIRCIDTVGHELWTKKLGKDKKGIIGFAYSPAIASPTWGENKVFITSNDGVLHALNCSNGEVLWERDEHNLGYSSPLYHDGKVYCAISEGGNVFCVNAKDGKPLWQNKTGSVIYDSSFAYANGQVFIASVDGTFSCLNAQSGKIQWQYSLGPGHCLASPTTDERQVYIANMAGQVTALPLAVDKALAESSQR